MGAVCGFCLPQVMVVPCAVDDIPPFTNTAIALVVGLRLCYISKGWAALT